MVHLFAALISTCLLVGGVAIIGLTLVRRFDAIVAALDYAAETACRVPPLPYPVEARTRHPVVRTVSARTTLRSLPRRVAA